MLGEHECTVCVEEKDVARLRDLAHLVHVQRMLRVRVWQAETSNGQRGGQ